MKQTINSALDKLIESKYITNDNSEVDVLLNPKRLNDLCVEDLLLKITPENSFDENYNSVAKDDAGVDRERSLYNQYLLKYFTTLMIRHHDRQSPTAYMTVYEDAVSKAIYMTTQRLYGDWSFLDKSQTTSLASYVKKRKENIDKPDKPRRKAPISGRMRNIFDYIVEQSSIPGNTRDTIILDIEQKFDIKSRSTSTTYYTSALRYEKESSQ